MNIAEVAYEVGFNDPKYFYKMLHETFQCDTKRTAE